MGKRRWFFLILLLWSPMASGASPAPTPGERVEVRLAQFDVVVRNKKGAIVSGLGPSDFTVLEDGSPMEVVAVDEWGASEPRALPAPAASAKPAGDAPPAESAAKPEAEPERRSFVLVFDALGDTTALRMNQAKRAASGFLRAHLRPDDLAAVYQLDLSLHAVSGVTPDANELARAIDKITWMAASSLQDDIAESVLSSNQGSFAPVMKERLTNLSVNAAQELDWRREHVYESLNDLASMFRGLPGRRVLVLVSPGFPLTTAGDQKTGAGGFTPRFRELIRSLATYGVTVYSLDIGNDLAAGDVSQSIDWRIAVGKLGMDENTLSDLGLERSLGTSSASSRREFLGVIAAETGGRLLAQTDLSKAFEAIQEESTRFYRISCRVPVTSTGDRYRKLLVKLKGEGAVVTSRRGRYSDITPLDRPRPAGPASVESLDRYHPLATRGVALPLPGTDPKKVPVAVVVEALGPIELTADPKGGAALDVEFRLVARAAGEIVDRYERSFTARIKPDGVAAVRRAFRVEGRLLLLPGVYELQSSVRLGDPPQLASWSATVAVPPNFAGAVPAIAGALLCAGDEGEAPLLSRPSIPDDADPLTLKPGTRILPATHVDYDVGGSLLVLFWMRGWPEAGDKPPQLDLAVHIADPQGQTVTLPTKMLFFGKEPSGGYRALARVETATLAPGGYSLKLEAGITGRTDVSARRAVSFTVRAKDAAAPITSSSAPVTP
jgi:VWFA-related protein